VSTRERLDLASMVDNIELSCEANRHAGFTPAAWVLRQTQCCQRKTVGLICDPCLTRFTQGPPARCGKCGTRKPACDWIASCEPINSPSHTG
jgi:hypothetical protein